MGRNLRRVGQVDGIACCSLVNSHRLHSNCKRNHPSRTIRSTSKYRCLILLIWNNRKKLTLTWVLGTAMLGSRTVYSPTSVAQFDSTEEGLPPRSKYSYLSQCHSSMQWDNHIEKLKRLSVCKKVQEMNRLVKYAQET